MKKSIIKTVVLAALMALPMFAKAQTFAGITAEQNAQNTPEGWTAVALPQLPAITSANTFNIKDYGASTSAADNTKAIQKALDAVPSTGGMVVIPAGTWMFGSADQMTTSKTEVLSIKSKTVLHLCAGATLKLVEYGKAPNNKIVFIGGKNKGKNVTDIVIEGEGETSVIDGQGARWWLARENGETFNPGAMIRFEQGKHFLLRNFKIQNTPGVNITISNRGKASHATIHDVTISEPSSEAGRGKASHNTDGISIWGPYVNIYNCNISNGDDNIVCDNDAQYIHVWNCYFGTGHGASIGSFTKNIKHIWFDNITMNGTTAGIRMKTGQDVDKTTNKVTLRGGGEEDWKFTNFTTYARTTGKVGVCLVTSGPGATNLVTGLATANYDSVPLVCFTGQVARHLIGNDAFQEVDIVGITRSITKYGVTVRNREDLGRIIKEAFYIARTGRPGPVLIDLPKDVMAELGSAEYPKTVNIRGYKPNTSVHIGQLKRALKMLQKAKKPLFLAGGGVIISRAQEIFTQVVE